MALHDIVLVRTCITCIDLFLTPLYDLRRACRYIVQEPPERFARLWRIVQHFCEYLPVAKPLPARNPEEIDRCVEQDSNLFMPYVRSWLRERTFHDSLLTILNYSL